MSASTVAAPTAAALVERAELNRVKVAIVDDHAVLRAAVRSVLSLEPDLEVVGEADDGVKSYLFCARLLPTSSCWICRCRHEPARPSMRSEPHASPLEYSSSRRIRQGPTPKYSRSTAWPGF